MILNISKIVGENVHRLRTQNKWSGQTLAELMDTNPQNVSGIERGKRGLSTKQIEKLCAAFGCLPVELFQMPDDTNGDLLKTQLVAEIAIMCREDVATLCAHAVALNAARGIKPTI